MLKSWTIGSKVGRRMTAMFVMAAMIPIGLMTLVTIGSLKSSQLIHAQDLLRQETKLYGLIVFDRLQSAATIFQIFDDEQLLLDESSRDIFETVSTIADEASDGALAKLDPAQRSHLNQNTSPLLFVDYSLNPARVSLLRKDEEGLIQASFNSNYLWGDTTNIPLGNIAVIDDLGLIFARSAKLTPDDVETLEASWELYLGTYGQADWQFSIAKQLDNSQTLFGTFGNNIFWILLLSLLAVALLSMTQIRRTLNPLSVLKSNINKLRQGDFSGTEPLKSGDEFEEVSRSFHHMATDLETNFGIQAELSRLDALILNGGSPAEKLEAAGRCADLILKNQDFSLILFNSDMDFDSYKKCTATPQLNGILQHSVETSSATLRSMSDGRLSLHQTGFIEELTGDASIAEQINTPFFTLIENRDELFGFIITELAKDDEGSDSQITQIKDLCSRLAVAASAERQHNQLRKQANFDSLTGLPNRYSVMEALANSIEHCKKRAHSLSVYFIDLNGFKDINDSLGHSFGDQLLISVSKRLREYVDEKASLARLGGDEFVIFIEHESDTHEPPAQLAISVIQSLESPFFLNKSKVQIGASIGIAEYPEDGITAEQLLINADIAMYEAKKENHSCSRRYTPQMNDALNRRITTVSRLTTAMDKHQLEWHLQPRISATTGNIIGAEALVRWRDPEQGYIFPQDFIEAAEESGLIERLGAMAMQSTCEALLELENRGFSNISLSVNVSLNEFKIPGFVAQLARTIETTGVNPSRLELEITESTLAESYEDARHIISEIRTLGVKIALDDFGTGFSSLRYLQELEFDALKIDRNFVSAITDKKQSYAITQTIIDLAHMLGKPVVAECVETTEQRDLLKTMTCDYFQGWLFDRAMPLEQFLTRLEETQMTESSTDPLTT